MKTLRNYLLIIIFLGRLGIGQAQQKEIVLVEAESFHDYGGWTLDAQFIDQMGSAYLMAHGMGLPVKNAYTKVRFSSMGEYNIFVRTMNWVPGYLTGEFTLHIDGQVFGGFLKPSDSRDWKWYKAGSVIIKEEETLIELKDLTGFNGRCDAIIFVKTDLKNFIPPNETKALSQFRNRLSQINKYTTNAGNFDLVVVGGGFSGICASVAAARLGLKVALIQNRPVLGGNASSEIKVNPIGQTKFPPYIRNADIVLQLLDTIDQRTYSRLELIDYKRLDVVLNERNISLFLNTHANEVKTKHNRITSINAIDVQTGQKLKFKAPLFVDCTGDGTIGYLAGAEYRIGREGRSEFNESLAPIDSDSMMMGNTQYWYAKEESANSSFPSCPWALQIDHEKMYKVPTPRWPIKLAPGIIASAAWNWESGFNRNTIDEAEYIRDHNLRAIFGVWDFLKNKSPEKQKYATGKLQWVASVLGKRESRRLVGDVLLTQNDIMHQKEFTDGCVTTTWYFDLHYPHPQNSKYFPGEEFRSIAYDDPNWELYKDNFPGEYIEIEPYLIPFRCLYSKNIQNLMMAGRNISVTHAALATTRVMQTCGMMGTVVGRAAYILRKHNADPKMIFEKYLNEFSAVLLNPAQFEKE